MIVINVSSYCIVQINLEDHSLKELGTLHSQSQKRVIYDQTTKII